MISGSTRVAAAIFLLLAVTCHADYKSWGTSPGGLELVTRILKYREFAISQCSCFQHDNCEEYIKCIESEKCNQWYNDIATAKKNVGCEPQKDKLIECGVAYGVIRMILNDMDNEKKVTPTCLEPYQDNWKCKDVRNNIECLKQMVEPFKCGMLVEVLEKEVCSGKPMLEALYSLNLAKYANQNLKK